MNNELALINYELPATVNTNNVASVTDILGQIKKLVKAIDTKRKAELAPILDKQREINAKYNPDISKLNELKRAIDTKLKTFHNQQQLEAEADRRRVIQDTGEVVQVMNKYKGRVVTSQGSATTREVMKAEVEAADKVPRKYCVPALPLINAAVKAGVKEIKGVKIYKDIQIINK